LSDCEWKLLLAKRRLLGDWNAVKKGKVGKRVAGKASGKFLRKLFR
jgi:hypothetical protein